MNFKISAPLAAALLCGTTAAQDMGRLAPIPGPVRDAGVYHVATGEWTRAQTTYGILGTDTLYRNDIPSGYFGLLDQDESAYEVGRSPVPATFWGTATATRAARTATSSTASSSATAP